MPFWHFQQFPTSILKQLLDFSWHYINHHCQTINIRQVCLERSSEDYCHIYVDLLVFPSVNHNTRPFACCSSGGCIIGHRPMRRCFQPSVIGVVFEPEGSRPRRCQRAMSFFETPRVILMDRGSITARSLLAFLFCYVLGPTLNSISDLNRAFSFFETHFIL